MMSSAKPTTLFKDNNNQSQNILDCSAIDTSIPQLGSMQDEDKSRFIFQKHVYENVRIVNREQSNVSNLPIPSNTTGERKASPQVAMTEPLTTTTKTADEAVRKPSPIRSSNRLITTQILTKIDEERHSCESSSTSTENPSEGWLQTISSNSQNDEILPEKASSLDELFKCLNLPSELLSFFDDTARDGKQNCNSRINTFDEDEDHTYEQVCETDSVVHDYDEVTNSNVSTESCEKEAPPIDDQPIRKRCSGSLSLEPLHQNYRVEGNSVFYVDLVTETSSDAHTKEREQSLLLLKDGSTAFSEPHPEQSRNHRTRVSSRLISALNCKSSSQLGVDSQTELEMIPKPQFSEHLISHQDCLYKFSIGLIMDMFNEWKPCSVVLSEKIIHTYHDSQMTKTKESLDLHFMLSLQNRVKYKSNIEGEINMYCFEVVLALPKEEGSFDKKYQEVSNLNLVPTRQSYTFGAHKRSDRNLWMAKILQSVTDVFPETCLTEFIRAGWCYMKKSVSSSWSGTWILLAKRRLYFYDYQDQQLHIMDLRKARCIGEIESDESIIRLHTDPGPSLFIDCPPFATLYFIMALPRETQTWKKIIENIAHNNGTSMQSQQLTNNEVPVMIDKCINFIYAYGSMSEGIYRNSGSSSQVKKILQLFKENAFAVHLTRAEFSEYDVAETLKRFIQEIPDSFLGSYATKFVSIPSLQATGDKISCYKELLSQLHNIEYQTLKKLIGHLNFIASLEKHNKMDIPNLAMIWALALMTNSTQHKGSKQNFEDEANFVADLIVLYKNLFPISPEETKMEQLMLKILQNKHVKAEDLFNTVKHSGDLKVWIKMECDEETVHVTENEENTHVNVTITPIKTASDICKELASKTSYEWYKLILIEVISDGALTRPVHYSEKVLEIVLRWSYWDEADRKNNYLAMRPTTTLNDVLWQIQQAPLPSQTTELKFAGQQTKTLHSYKLQLIGREIGVLKQLYNQKYEKVMTIDLDTVHAYLGREAKRDQSSLLWAITLVEHDFKKRTRDAPYIGHILEATDLSEQIRWYSSILHSLHPDDILPSDDSRPSTWL